ncbi:MAG: protein kinase [Thermomicrobiales bacterium]
MTIRTKLINRRYRLERRMTLGETTETWLGFDNVLHRAVAVTVPRQELMRSAPFLADFLQRSRIATALHHRGIVAAFDSGEDGETPYLITEYTGGEQLTDIIRLEAPFDVDDVAILVEQVAGALEYAHQRGFVHGQLSTADVVVDSQGAAKLFGLGLPSGSVVDGISVTFDEDVQALAAIAFEMLTGEAQNSVERHSAGDAYLIAPDVPRNASDIVAIGLGAGAFRFSSAETFARTLSAWREFDPGAHFVPSLSEVTPPALDFRSAPPVLGQSDFELDPWFESVDLPVTRDPAPEQSKRGVRLALLAALLLALVAGIIVWQGDKATAGIPPGSSVQMESLAELAGF